MTPDLGSYAFGTFSSNETELERLERQASIAWPLERRLLQAAGLRPGLRVVDLACGPGVIARHLCGEVGPGGAVTGVDLNPALLDVARSRPAPADAAALAFHEDSVYELASLDEGAFDLAYARFLFQHLDRPHRALERIRARLRPGGTLILVDSDDALFDLSPAPDGLDRFLALAEAGQRGRGGDRTIGRRLAGLMHAAGFVDVRPQVVTLTTRDIPADDFLAITTAFKLELLPEEEKAWGRGVLAAAHRAAAAGDLMGFTGVYFVTGTAPG